MEGWRGVGLGQASGHSRGSPVASTGCPHPALTRRLMQHGAHPPRKRRGTCSRGTLLPQVGCVWARAYRAEHLYRDIDAHSRKLTKRKTTGWMVRASLTHWNFEVPEPKARQRAQAHSEFGMSPSHSPGPAVLSLKFPSSL